MLVNRSNLQTLNVSFNSLFKNGMGEADSRRSLIATEVPSSTASNEYGWLGKMPNMRKWIGDRVINSIKSHGYTIKNDDWEDTLAVGRNDIEDDNIGIYSPLFTEMGRATAAHPEMLCWDALKAGFTTPCYDGQNYFDTDHPVLNADGEEESVSNFGGGNGTPWFLIDNSRALKPIIFQSRKKPQFVAKDNPTDDNVFHKKEFLYGVDARYNVGYGFWQFAYGSKQELTDANYAAAFAALEGMKGDYGRPLGLKPTTLIVPPSLREKALQIVNATHNAAGASNVWKDTAKLEVVSWLA